MNSKFENNILKSLLFTYLSISIPISLLIRNIYLIKLAPSSLNFGDFKSYLNRSNLSLDNWTPNYGFTIFIRFFKLQDINQIESILLAKIITTIGVMILIISILKILQYNNYSNKRIKEILYLFTILISINPYYSISGFKLSTETFIYIGIGLIYILSNSIIIRNQITVKNSLPKEGITQYALRRTLIIIIFYLLVCSARNILLIGFLPLLYLFFRKIDIKNISTIANNINNNIKSNTINTFLSIFLIAIFLFDIYLFINYIEPYLSSRGNIFAGEINSNIFSILKNFIIKFPTKFINILGIRESATIHSNYFLEVNPYSGAIVSNNIFLTNILPSILYIPFNLIGIFLVCKNKLLKHYFWIILPCLVPSFLGVTHMRYLYPCIPAITLGWSFYLLDKKFFWRKVINKLKKT
tara:strand:- start:222 stop:1457 length:1236 start_codon:yes stop_codon:yes gene_type:complete